MAKVSCAWRVLGPRGGDQQRAGIEDGGHGGEPALVVVLRTVVAKDGIGDVGFEHLRAPAFPLRQQLGQGLVAAVEAVAQEQFPGGWRRAGAGVQQRDSDFAVRERGVKHRHIADDEADEARPMPASRQASESRQCGRRQSRRPGRA